MAHRIVNNPGDVDRSINDICVEISRHHNRIWEHAKEVALRDREAETPNSTPENNT